MAELIRKLKPKMNTMSKTLSEFFPTLNMASATKSLWLLTKSGMAILFINSYRHIVARGT